METTGQVVADIHTLIQQRDYDFWAFIRDYGEQIDNHVLDLKTYLAAHHLHAKDTEMVF